MRILIVDDHPVMRFGVCQLIGKRWPDAAIGEAENLEQALALAREEAWNVAVLDLSLPDTGGLEGLAQLRRAASALPILVLSMHAEAAYASRALQLGAAGYLTKEHATTELITAIERVLRGGRYISTGLAERLAGVLGGKARRACPTSRFPPRNSGSCCLSQAVKRPAKLPKSSTSRSRPWALTGRASSRKRASAIRPRWPATAAPRD